MLADRMEFMEGSGVRKMFELIASMKDPINLSIGQAHYDAPEEMKEAAIRAIQEGRNRYTVTQGIPDLNRATLDWIEENFGHRPEGILTSAGVSGGLLLSSLALLNPGDEVLLPDPYFVMYKNVLAISGARAAYYDLYPAEAGRGWHPDLDQMAGLVTDRTKAVLLNSPSNPTGGVLSEAELDGIFDLAERKGLWILSDEIYSHFVYDGLFASVIPRMKRWNRCLVFGGFSKTWGVPGWRLGWVVGPPEVLDAMKILQQYTYVCPPSPLQYGALKALSLDMDHRREEYRKKRDLVSAKLQGLYSLVPSEGSFYAFPSYPEGREPQAFLEACIEKRLLIVPGAPFSRRNTNFRLSFAASDETLGRGLEVLREIAAG